MGVIDWAKDKAGQIASAVSSSKKEPAPVTTDESNNGYFPAQSRELPAKSAQEINAQVLAARQKRGIVDQTTGYRSVWKRLTTKQLTDQEKQSRLLRFARGEAFPKAQERYQRIQEGRAKLTGGYVLKKGKLVRVPGTFAQTERSYTGYQKLQRAVPRASRTKSKRSGPGRPPGIYRYRDPRTGRPIPTQLYHKIVRGMRRESQAVANLRLQREQQALARRGIPPQVTQQMQIQRLQQQAMQRAQIQQIQPQMMQQMQQQRQFIPIQQQQPQVRYKESVDIMTGRRIIKPEIIKRSKWLDTREKWLQ
jgi:hypothetical protein